MLNGAGTGRHLIEDPYGWINAYLGNEGPPASRWGRPRGDDIALKMVSGDCFDDIYDAGRDDLHIPRVMAWAVEPRSREYMNMELPPAELHELYFASLERRVTDQRADYSEEGLRELVRMGMQQSAEKEARAVGHGSHVQSDAEYEQAEAEAARAFNDHGTGCHPLISSFLLVP